MKKPVSTKTETGGTSASFCWMVATSCWILPTSFRASEASPTRKPRSIAPCSTFRSDAAGWM